MAGGRKKSGPRATFMRYDDNHTSPSGHSAYRNAGQPPLERSGLKLVQQVWEELCRHQLEPPRAEVFRQHPDAIHLADCTPTLLRNSASVAIANNPGHHLLLSEWWQTAQSRAAERAKW